MTLIRSPQCRALRSAVMNEKRHCPGYSPWGGGGGGRGQFLQMSGALE